MSLGKTIKTAFSICAQNFRKWATDYRMWVVGAIIVIMTFVYAHKMLLNAEAMGSDMTIWIFPFLYCRYYDLIMFVIPLVLMFCNAPFLDKNQTFVMMRASSVTWFIGQILYIIIASAAYFLFIFLLSVLMTVFTATPSLNWGNTIYTLAYRGFYDENVPLIDIPRYIIDFFTPLQACWFTFLMSWLAGIFLGLIVFSLNLITETRNVGTIIAMAFVIWGAWVGYSGMIRHIKFSPITWITVDKIDVGGMTLMPSLSYCITVYLISIAVMTAAVFLFGRKKSFDFKE